MKNIETWVESRFTECRGPSEYMEIVTRVCGVVGISGVHRIWKGY